MPPVIHSLKNPRVQRAVKLRDRHGRQQQGRLIIDGVRELALALRAGIEPVEVFVSPSQLRSDAARQLMRQLADRGVDVLDVTPAVMEKLQFGSRGEGLVAVARTPEKTLEQLSLQASPLIVVLERIEKPGNVGAVIRTADGAGVDAVVICDGGTDLYNPNAIRSSQGTVFAMPVATATTEEAIRWLAQVPARVLAARVQAPINYADADYTGAVAIVLGNEATGLSDAWSPEKVTAIRLPMHGTADSLNVSAAAAVLVYEAQRQRRKDEG